MPGERKHLLSGTLLLLLLPLRSRWHASVGEISDASDSICQRQKKTTAENAENEAFVFFFFKNENAWLGKKREKKVIFFIFLKRKKKQFALRLNKKRAAI